MDSDKTLDKIRDIIIEAVHPDKIILFGSRTLYDKEVNKPVDVLTANPEKFEKNKKDPYMIYKDVDTRGIVLYG